MQAGALALLIADDGGCGEAFECGPRIGSLSAGHGLAQRDSPSDWAAVHIPVVMISAASAARIMAQLAPLTQRIPTAEFGEQRVLVYRQ